MRAWPPTHLHKQCIHVCFKHGVHVRTRLLTQEGVGKGAGVHIGHRGAVYACAREACRGGRTEHIVEGADEE